MIVALRSSEHPLRHRPRGVDVRAERAMVTIDYHRGHDRTGVEKCPRPPYRDPSTTSSSAPARPAACWPTDCRPTPRRGAAPGGGRPGRLLLDRHSRSAISTPSAIRAPTGASRPSPNPGLNGRSIGYARGKVLGGCSSINAMIYMRGQRSDYDHWAALGNRGWSWDDVLPVFKRSEDYEHGADELHGAGGELRVEERRVSWEILDAWRDAAAGVRHPEDPRVQPRRQLRQRLLPDEPAARRALERDQGVPAAGRGIGPICTVLHRRSRAARHDRAARRRRSARAASSCGWPTARPSTSRRAAR